MLKRLINSDIIYIKDIVEDKSINNNIINLIKVRIVY